MNVTLHHRKTKLSFFGEIIPKIKSVEIPKHAAALAFYAISAMAPLIIIFVSLSGLIIDQSIAETRLLTFFQNRVGEQSTSFINDLIESLKQSKSHLTFSFIGFFITFYGLSHFFNTLKGSFFAIFGVKLGLDENLKKTFLNYLKSLGFSVYLVFLILMIVFISVIAPLILSFSANFFGLEFFAKSQLLNFFLVFVSTILLLTLMYKTVGSKKTTWKSSLTGAIICTILFGFLNAALILYFNLFYTNDAVYGASGSFIAVLLWVYYSTQVLLIGAIVAAISKTNPVVYLK
ncbi:MAG: YihY/virulence factor BrkB family protein [Patescibacteria group bacterium]